MKQKKSNWRIARNVVRNLARLFWAIVCYLAVETKFRIKWLVQDLSAITAGYKNHADMMQVKLDRRHSLYRLCYR